MATRGERMQQRIRGAGRNQVDDISFQLELPDETQTEIASPAKTLPRTTPTPNTSAKRRRLDTDSAQALHPSRRSAGNPSSRRTSARLDPYDLQEESSRESVAALAAGPTSSPDAVLSEDGPDSVESLPAAAPALSRSTVSRTSRRSAIVTMEVEESPVHSPGSGRRKVRISGAASSSTRLHDALNAVEETETVPLSSPLARKSRRGTAPAARASRTPANRRTSQLSDTNELDELSPDQSAQTPSLGREQSPDLSLHIDLPGAEQESLVQLEPQEDPDESQDIAEEVDVNEAAQRLGTKRPRRSLRVPSPDLETVVEEEAPAPKRRRREVQENPAKQKQGRHKPKQVAKQIARPAPEPVARPKPIQREVAKALPKLTPKDKPTPQPKPRVKQKSLPTQKPAKPAARRKSEKKGNTDEDDTIPITVQRFTKNPQAANDDADVDVLNSEIPFAGRSGVNTIDVLTQMCEEVIGSSIDKLYDGVRNAGDASTKKEYRVKLRALEAFQEELKTRFLQHTIFLDTLHALRKRVRSAQKEKLALRDEIMRIRSERDQVALRMDAARIKHEQDSKEALHQLSLSSAMHDIDLAIERGRAAPELSAAEQKWASLANLEILIARVTDPACSRSDTGGNLKQIREFNAFLERAAVALEAR